MVFVPYLGPGPLGPLAPLTPGSPAPMMGVNMSMAHRLPDNQIVGGPFGGVVHPGGVPMLSSGGNLVVVSGFGGGSVSRFKRLDDAQDKFKKVIKNLKNPNCVINKKGGMAVWLTDHFTHTFNDTDTKNVCNIPGGNPNMELFFRTKVILNSPPTIFTQDQIALLDCVSYNEATRELSLASDSIFKNLAALALLGFASGIPNPTVALVSPISQNIMGLTDVKDALNLIDKTKFVDNS